MVCQSFDFIGRGLSGRHRARGLALEPGQEIARRAPVDRQAARTLISLDRPRRPGAHLAVEGTGVEADAREVALHGEDEARVRSIPGPGGRAPTRLHQAGDHVVQVEAEPGSLRCRHL